MALPVGFSGLAQGQSICSKAMAGLTLGSSSFRSTCLLGQNKMKSQRQCIPMKRRAQNKLLSDRGLHLVMSSKSDSNTGASPLSPSDTIKQFYTCINDKNLKQLREFISDDCYFDDRSFPEPFQGKKEVMHFFEQLIACMGKNVKFNIGHICEGDEFIAGVDWHLEWKKNQVPFTRGCSFYECSKAGERLIIKKAQVVIESPIKPGSLVLTLLKTVTMLFDEFPKATEWFLKSPHVIFKLLLKIYDILLMPLIKPLLTCYINLWNFMAGLLGYTLNILIFISKIFFK